MRADFPSAKFTAIWQSTAQGADWPLYHWLLRLFEPYISETVFDGHRQVVMDNVILFDAWVYANDPAYYAKFKGKNAFLVHIGDEFLQLGHDRYVNFRGVFRMIWSSVFNPEHVMTIPLGSYIQEPPESITPVANRRYAWSFIGDAGKVSRPEMVRAFSSIEPHFCFSSMPVSGMSFFERGPSGKRRVSASDMFQILGDSVFAPSAMGNATIESCRPYDALEAGAIPIVERRMTLDYYRGLLGEHPLPTFASWREARQFANRLLNEPVQLAELQQSCVQWWANYKRELVRKIGAFLEERSRAGDAPVPLRSRLPHLPYWQYAELLRHHSASALGRRVSRQVTRFVRQGKWRVATRTAAAQKRSPGR